MKHMTRKKALSLFLSFIMIIASMPMAFASSPADFVDFPTGWSKEAVTAAVENGLLNGRSADRIEPQGNLTRAEMATIINRAFGATVEADVSDYTDLEAGSWYYHEIAKAVNMQTFQGDGDNTMRPDATITREEVFAVIARALVLETDDYSSLDKFQDKDAVSGWAKTYAAILVAKGYVNGDDNGNLNPRSNITREEFAQIMHNIIKTYYVSSGTYNTAGVDSALIRTGGVRLENVTIDGDLILGDGVGTGNVELVNVTIKGRLLARGGEGRVTLTNTTVGEKVVVKDVNGLVNFFNYRTEAPFANIQEITMATFRKPSSGGGFGGGGGGSSDNRVYVPYYITYFREDAAGTVFENGKSYVQLSEYDIDERAISGATILVPGLPVTLEGYEPNTEIGYGQYIDTRIRVSANLHIKIYYDVKEYTVSTKDPSGADINIVFKHGTTMGENSEWQAFKDAHPDHTFIYTDENDIKKEVTDDLKVTDNMTFDLVSRLRVTFDKNDGSGETEGPVSMFVGEILGDKLPTGLTREGYELAGWNSAADGSGNAYTKDSEIDVSTLYAQWTPITYTIAYNIDVDFVEGATVPESYNIETEVILPGAESIAEKPGYAFEGWYKEAECINKVTTIPVGTTGDITLYANWIDLTKEYKEVTFDYNYDGAEAVVRKIEVNQPVAQPEDPERAGFTFGGWYTDAACTAAYDFNTPVTENITLYAKWTEIIVYKTVTFDLNYEGAPAATTEEVAVGQAVSKPADPERADYNFIGWYVDAEGTEEYDFATAVDADITLYAKWILKTVPTNTVTFDFNYEGAPAARAETVVSGQAVSEPADPERTGYSFEGWFTEGGAAYDFAAAVDADITLYAKWATVSYTITYETNGGAAVNNGTYDIETAATLPLADSMSKAGYDFAGWYDNAAFDGNPVTEIAVGNHGDKTFYAKWEVVPYDITYDNGKGQLKDGVTATGTYNVESGTIILPTAADFNEVPGYSFGGWYDNAAFDGNAVTEVAAGSIGDREYYAKWDVISYKITYAYGEGQLKDGVTAVNEYNIESNAITLPTANDFVESDTYEFKGWYETEDFSGAAVTEIPAGSYGMKNYYAKWVLKSVPTYIVTFDLNYEGAPAATTDEVAEGQAVGKPADPERADYVFAGWYVDAACETLYDFTAAVDANFTLYAKWILDTIPTYTVTFDYNYDGAPEANVVTVESGLAVSKPVDPVRANYVFGGWYTNAECTEEYDFATAVDADITLYAKWTEVEKVTVTFYDGAVADEDLVINTFDLYAYNKMTQEEIDAALADFEPFAYDGYTEGAYTHKILPELWYTKADGSWAIFDSSVVVEADMNVYYAFKNLSLYFNLQLGDATESINFSVPYESDTRIMDSIKDALTLGRNQIKTAVSANGALNKGDYYLEALAKAGEKTGIVDGQGNLKYIQMDAALHEIIDVNEIDAEVKEYIETLFVVNTDDAKIDSIVQLAAETDVVQAILGGAEYDYEIVKAHINGLSEEERIQLADDFHAVLAQQTFYVEFINTYAAEHAEFHVTHESVDLVMALATAVNDYTYDELKARIHAKFGSFIDIIGDEAAEDFLRDAQDRYYAGALAVWEDVHAHDDQASYESTYPSYLTFKLDMIEHLFKNLYPANHEKAIDKFKTIDIYHYAENPYLQQLIAATEVDAILNTLFVPVEKTDENIGYAFYPSTDTESGFMHYYDYALEMVKLFDHAMLWYDDNLTAEEMEELRTRIFDDAAKAANKANEMLAAYEKDGTLPLGLDMDKLMEYEAFAKVYEQVEDKLLTALEKFKSTEFYGKAWDVNSIRSEIPYAEEAVSVLLGVDVPTFTIDTMMNKKAVFDKAGFVDYEYTEDAEAGTVTVQAIERILKGNIARVRRYYQ